jgi:hypothetical protein
VGAFVSRCTVTLKVQRFDALVHELTAVQVTKREPTASELLFVGVQVIVTLGPQLGVAVTP